MSPAPDRTRRIAALAAALLIGALGGAWLTSIQHAPAPQEATAATTWTCSMHPQIREAQPGACPLCGMDLIPATTSEDAGPADAVVLSERARTLARLRTTEVRPLAEEGSILRLLGRLETSESARRTVTAWVGGRVDRLLVTTTGEQVRAGQIIARLYSPEVYTAHQDLLTTRDQLARLESGAPSAKAAAAAAFEAARDRLRLLGVPADDLARLEAAEHPTETVPIRSPHAGTVLAREVTQGQYVKTGSPLFEVARLDPLWVQLDAYEQDLARLEVGQRVRLEVEALPGEPFEGRVSFVDPTLDPIRRTARVRVEVANPDGRLRPGFFVEAVVETPVPTADAPLVIPTSAALYTGQRSVVYVEQETARGLAYTPRTVRLGPRLGDVYPVLAGLEAGEMVVSRGAFVLDADLQIRGGPSMMTHPDDPERDAHSPIELGARDRDALAPVLTAYLDIQTALAADDFDGARTAAQALVDAAASARLPAEADAVWGPLSASLRTDAGLVARADSIALARNTFAGVSSTIQTVLTRLGNPLDTPVHLAYCPMAFDNHGGHWVQAGETVDNAYYGAAMRQCGEFQATIGPDQHLESSADAGHQP